MSAITLALIFALATVLMAEFVNGWTDAPNVIATVVAPVDDLSSATSFVAAGAATEWLAARHGGISAGVVAVKPATPPRRRIRS